MIAKGAAQLDDFVADKGAGGLPVKERRRKSGRRVSATRASGRRVPVLAATALLLVLLAAIVGPFLPFVHPYDGILAGALQPPAWGAGGSSAHLLGTDALGRDTLSRLLVGAQTTVLISISAVLASMIFGTIVGLIAGYFGGALGAVLMRITDAMLAIPVLVLGMALAVALGPSTSNVVFVVAATTWAFFARVIRGEVISLREAEFVLAAELSGIPRSRLLAVHLLPNVVTPITVMATLQVGNTIILAASLSFLGLGVPNPQPEWGLMLADAKDYVQIAPWLVALPALCLSLTILCCNVLGDWVRDRFDPQSRIRT